MNEESYVKAIKALAEIVEKQDREKAIHMSIIRDLSEKVAQAEEQTKEKEN